MEIGTATNIDMYKSVVLSKKVTLLFVSRDLRGRRQKEKSKEHNETDDAMREQPGSR